MAVVALFESCCDCMNWQRASWCKTTSLLKLDPCKTAPVHCPLQNKSIKFEIVDRLSAGVQLLVHVSGCDGFTLWLQPHIISLSSWSMSCRRCTATPPLPNVIVLMYFHSHWLQMISMWTSKKFTVEVQQSKSGQKLCDFYRWDAYHCPTGGFHQLQAAFPLRFELCKT